MRGASERRVHFPLDRKIRPVVLSLHLFPDISAFAYENLLHSSYADNSLFCSGVALCSFISRPIAWIYFPVDRP